MNKLCALLVAIISLTPLSTGTLAQEYEGCFMIDGDGNVIKLNNLCPEEPPVPTTTTTTTNPEGVFQIPIKRREGGIPVVDVVFNGNEAGEMLFDTGASATLIAPSTAEKLNLVPFDTARIATASASDIEVEVARLNSLQVGDAILEQVLVTIAPPEVEDGLQGMGLLGQNFYGQYDITIKEDVIELRVRN
ncbi:retropepsin-like aspartic protease family protein [Phormidium sp. CCY1219]|uniref:retropepsin-like aspartic protease family protein n=1 Tax=Phormidium sp. CCY1219 TaxID=2886104 RepID=UPI002D1F8ED6|nr:retropepsin-like aspartic protease [Phormidium sp. CCY1219]MEB3828054.1 retroviral-like aspartic protease family protein [Phormidium sp. CCY1219]